VVLAGGLERQRNETKETEAVIGTTMDSSTSFNDDDELLQLLAQQVRQYHPDTVDLQMALQRVPHLIQTESSPQKFYQWEKFRLDAAVKRLALYWKRRLQLFRERAYLPLTCTGHGALSKTDVEIFQTKCCTMILPGVPVLFRTFRPHGVPNDVQERLDFYCLHLLSERRMDSAGPDAGVPSFVALYVVDSMELDQAANKQSKSMCEAHCVQLQSVYVFSNDNAKQAAALALPQLGLSVESLPPTLGGTFTQEKWESWVKERQELDRNRSSGYKYATSASDNLNGTAVAPPLPVAAAAVTPRPATVAPTPVTAGVPVAGAGAPAAIAGDLSASLREQLLANLDLQHELMQSLTAQANNETTLALNPATAALTPAAATAAVLRGQQMANLDLQHELMQSLTARANNGTLASNPVVDPRTTILNPAFDPLLGTPIHHHPLGSPLPPQALAYGPAVPHVDPLLRPMMTHSPHLLVSPPQHYPLQHPVAYAGAATPNPLVGRINNNDSHSTNNPAAVAELLTKPSDAGDGYDSLGFDDNSAAYVDETTTMYEV